MVRLHGRNRETWAQKVLPFSAERFNYLYSGEELNDLAKPIRGLAEKALQVHVLFGNNFTNYAQRNARELWEIVQA